MRNALQQRSRQRDWKCGWCS